MGELPGSVRRFEAGEHERALELLLVEIEIADAERGERLRELIVALFATRVSAGPMVVEHPQRR